MSTLGEIVVTLSASAATSIVVKSTLVALLGLMAVYLARRARASVRHVILAATLIVMLALPLASAVLPGVAIAVPVASARVEPAPPAPANPALTDAPVSSGAVNDSAATRWLPKPASIVLAVWALGAIVLAISLGAAIWQVGHIRRRALPWLDARETVVTLAAQAGVRREVDVLLHEDVAAPMTCGLRRPAIVLPPDATGWSEAALRRALVHELEHVRRGDWWIHLTARATCAAYWFQPLAWIAYRRLCLEAERACDDAVVMREEQTQYAEQLVALARRMAAAAKQPTLAMANRSDLSRRITAVLDQHQTRGRAGLLRPLLVAGAAAAIAIALAPARAVGAAGATRLTMGEMGGGGNEQRPPRVTVGRLDQALVEAADDGDVNGLRELLEAGANVNAGIPGDGSALIVAAREGHLTAVTFLLDRGADPNMGVSGDGAALIMAAREGHLRIVELLLNRGANIELVVDGDENALIQASAEGRLEVVKLLVERGANVNARVFVNERWRGSQEEWRTPLSQARRGGHRDVVAFLLAAGAVE